MCVRYSKLADFIRAMARPTPDPVIRRAIPSRVPAPASSSRSSWPYDARRLGFAGPICDWLTNLTVPERHAHQDPAES